MARRQRRSDDAPDGGPTLTLSPRSRNAIAGLVQWAWQRIIALGTVGPDDPCGRRFGAFGEGSAMSFPPGSVSGHRRIRIAAHTMIGAYVSLAAGMADDGPLPPDSDVVPASGARCHTGHNGSTA